MTTREILEELKHLTPAERLSVAEAALHLIREDLQRLKRTTPLEDQRLRLAAAAEALAPEYAAGGELTAFTTLDGEDFRASG